MKKLKYIIGILLIAGAFACEPNTGTEEGKEAIKKDTIDPREGAGEGDPGKGEIGGYKHNQ